MLVHSRLTLPPAVSHRYPFILLQSPVVLRPIRASPGLNFNPGFFSFLSRIFFFILLRVTNHQIVDKKQGRGWRYSVISISNTVSFPNSASHFKIFEASASLVAVKFRTPSMRDTPSRTCLWRVANIFWYFTQPPPPLPSPPFSLVSKLIELQNG